MLGRSEGILGVGEGLYEIIRLGWSRGPRHNVRTAVVRVKVGDVLDVMHDAENPVALDDR